jgi:hypothetical protein
VVNGRERSLAACTVVEADPASKKLPLLPANVAAVLAACGKAKKTLQAPLAGEGLTGPAPGVRLPNGWMVTSANPEAARAVHEIVVCYRGRMSEIVERAALPHQLPVRGAERIAVPGSMSCQDPRSRRWSEYSSRRAIAASANPARSIYDGARLET